MTKDQMVAALKGRAGTPAELALRCDCEPGDSTFRRALKECLDAGELFAAGSTRDRYYHPRHIASGFGAAVELGIARGPARTEAFAVMGARAAKSKHPIGSGKT